MNHGLQAYQLGDRLFQLKKRYKSDQNFALGIGNTCIRVIGPLTKATTWKNVVVIE